jgi:hypothetical protein
MTTDVEQLIEMSLIEARLAIELGRTWSPLVHIIHPHGVKSVVIRGIEGDSRPKNKIAHLINSWRKKLNGSLVITITANWVGDDACKYPLPRSLRNPFPGGREALIVAIWGLNGAASRGLQAYTRCADGTVVFDDLEWQEPSSEDPWGASGQSKRQCGRRRTQ